MREINECTAEVFRRSEERIGNLKRKRNRLLALCIPVCLLVVVGSVAIFPKMLNVNDKKAYGGSDGDIAESVYEGNANFVCMELESKTATAQSSVLSDDVDEVINVYHTVNSCFEVAAESDTKGADDRQKKKSENYSQTDVGSLASYYKIVFTSKDGYQMIFSLVGDKMKNESTGETVGLSSEKHAEILKILDRAITKGS